MSGRRQVHAESGIRRMFWSSSSLLKGKGLNCLALQQLMDEWLPISGGSGSIHVQVAFKPNQNQHLTIDSFELLKVIGKGSFGKVSGPSTRFFETLN